MWREREGEKESHRELCCKLTHAVAYYEACPLVMVSLKSDSLVQAHRSLSYYLSLIKNALKN